jgi:hypothetical protein
VRIADWGYYETVLAPLDKQWLVRLHSAGPAGHQRAVVG